MSKHTPGPWKACRSHEDYEGPYIHIDDEEAAEYAARPFTRIVAANGYVVMSAHDLSEMTPENARLIAAAPDLLAALEECVTGDGAHCLEYGTDTPKLRRRIAEINRIATQAIRKARGEA